MLRALDNDDLRILQLLQHDARLTNKEIADKIGKSVSPVYERIKRLQADGYIKQYTAILDNNTIVLKFGIGLSSSRRLSRLAIIKAGP